MLTKLANLTQPLQPVMNISLNCLNGLKTSEIVHQGVPAHDCLAFKGEEDVLKK